MSLTLIIGSPKDADNNYFLYSQMKFTNAPVRTLSYPEHRVGIKDVVKEVYHFLSNNRYECKYILTESIYVIGYLTLLQKANHLLDTGADINDILHSMENFVKMDCSNFKAFELNGSDCKDLIVTYDGKTRCISDENYPNQLIEQLTVDYNKLMDVAEDMEVCNGRENRCSRFNN